ncbi:MAG: pilus assembly protein TadG-related protein [Terracidiphilus sp.]
MRFRDDESGQMLVLTALCMTVLMGFLALAIDVGLLFRAKRNVQIAADAGAIAGALAEQYGISPSPACGGGVTPIACAVQNAVAANGVPASDIVAVNTNPTDGFHTGPGYVETILSVPNPTFFFSAFSGSKTSFSVAGRAVAGMAPSTACMYVLDPSDPNALTVAGSVTAPKCGIQVNSSSPNASCDDGQTLDVPFLHVVGGQDSGGGCGRVTSTQVVTGVAPSGDPLNNLSGLDPATSCNLLNTLTLGGATPTVTGATRIPSTTVTLGAVSVTISCFGDLNVLLSGLTLGRAGGNQVFIFLNGLQLLGNVRVNGTVEVAGGSLLPGGLGTLSVTAPADPADLFNGIAIYQPPTDTTPCTNPPMATPCLHVRLVGGGVTGIIYAPTARLTIDGTGGVGGIVAYQVDVDGPLNLTGNYNLANPTTSPLNKVELVE